MNPTNCTIDKVEKIIDIISNHLDSHEGCDCITGILKQFYDKKVMDPPDPQQRGNHTTSQPPIRTRARSVTNG